MSNIVQFRFWQIERVEMHKRFSHETDDSLFFFHLALLKFKNQITKDLSPMLQKLFWTASSYVGLIYL